MTTTTTTPQPPIARRDEEAVIYAGVAPPDCSDPTSLPRQSPTSTEALVDPPRAIPNPYGWLRDDKRERAEVLNHLKAENDYCQAMTSHLGDLRETIYQELLSRVQETDYTLPRPKGDYMYYTRTYEGKSYTVHCRAPRTNNTKIEWDGSAESVILPGEQVTLDVNKLSQGHKHCSMGAVKPSPSQRYLAYTVDFTGAETYQLLIQDLDNPDDDPRVFEGLETSGTIQWGANDDTLFYLKQDDTKRPYQLYKKDLKQDDAKQEDELLFTEPDGLFWCSASKTLDGKYLFLSVGSKETDEEHFLDLQDPNATLQCLAPRRNKVLYSADYHAAAATCSGGGTWWICSNVGGSPNLKLMTAPAKANSQDEWKLVELNGKPLFDGSHDRALESILVFSKHVVATGREDGIPRVWVMALTEEDGVSSCIRLEFPEAAHDVSVGRHLEYDTQQLVVAYDSLVTPLSHIGIDMGNVVSQRTVLKQRQVPGYDASLYGCERVTVTSRDGKAEIPVSMVYRKDVVKACPVPTHLYGYGSYGSSMEADFRSSRLPLLDRGMVYVIAHIRGGGELGRPWYEEPNGAKYLCKKNTFFDFIDVAKWLINDRKMTTSKLLSIEGRSAGGMLIGATMNLEPTLCNCALSGVPFVDVVCTMIDASIPLTEGEWVEWGNPNEEKYLDYMLEYSPMENVKKGAVYPSILMTCGLHDPRVQYWEPAKFCATLRHVTSNQSGPVLLKIDMDAGHFSASDRYKYLREMAFDYAFLLDTQIFKE